MAPATLPEIIPHIEASPDVRGQINRKANLGTDKIQNLLGKSLID